MTEYEIFKRIWDCIWFNIPLEVNITETIFSTEFMNKFKEYYFNPKNNIYPLWFDSDNIITIDSMEKHYLLSDNLYSIIDNLDDPLGYLYNLIFK